MKLQEEEAINQVFIRNSQSEEAYTSLVYPHSKLNSVYSSHPNSTMSYYNRYQPYHFHRGHSNQRNFRGVFRGNNREVRQFYQP